MHIDLFYKLTNDYEGKDERLYHCHLCISSEECTEQRRYRVNTLSIIQGLRTNLPVEFYTNMIPSI